LRFLRFKKTSPPQDIQPKKLRYDNYNENIYQQPRRLDILSPTPLKDQLNFNVTKVADANRAGPGGNINAYDQGGRKNYISKYPVEFTEDKLRFYYPSNVNNIQNNIQPPQRNTYNDLYNKDFPQHRAGENNNQQYNNNQRGVDGPYRVNNFGNMPYDNNTRNDRYNINQPMDRDRGEMHYNQNNHNQYARYYPAGAGNNNNLPNYIQQNIYQNTLNYNIIKAEDYINNKRLSINKTNQCGISPCLANVKHVNYDEIKPKKLEFTNKKNVNLF
jgi:hypothetical protein